MVQFLILDILIFINRSLPAPVHVVMHSDATDIDEMALVARFKQVDRSPKVTFIMRLHIAVLQCSPIKTVVDDHIRIINEFGDCSCVIMRASDELVDILIDMRSVAGFSNESGHGVSMFAGMLCDDRPNKARCSSDGDVHVVRIVGTTSRRIGVVCSSICQTYQKFR